MALLWEQVIIDSLDPMSLGRWWSTALGWVIVPPTDDPDEFEIRPSADVFPGLLFVRVSDPKSAKNRLHIDLRPDNRDDEVARLIAMGATYANVGQAEESWIVLADPEGNEFCVLSSRRR